MSLPGSPADRAAAAEAAILHRHLRPLFSLPGANLAVIGWPYSAADRGFVRWRYWWQAHFLDCLIDAQRRAPAETRRGVISSVVRGIKLRNTGHWTNGYYDDMAWLGLALQRGEADSLFTAPHGVQQLSGKLLGAWNDSRGGIPWRLRDDFRNTPANGPAAILLARIGQLQRATATVDWILDTLRDVDTGLIFDGIRGDGQLEREFYTYNQGVVIGALTGLVVAANSDPSAVAAREQQLADLVDAVQRHLCDDGVVRGRGGGDGGLFSGILSRYLAFAATALPATTAAGRHAVITAADLVRNSAEAAWRNRAEVDGQPLFGPEWSELAVIPYGAQAGRLRAGAVPSSDEPARDLSVQLSGWMLLEAAATLTGQA